MGTQNTASDARIAAWSSWGGRPSVAGLATEPANMHMISGSTPCGSYAMMYGGPLFIIFFFIFIFFSVFVSVPSFVVPFAFVRSPGPSSRFPSRVSFSSSSSRVQLSWSVTSTGRYSMKAATDRSSSHSTARGTLVSSGTSSVASKRASETAPAAGARTRSTAVVRYHTATNVNIVNQIDTKKATRAERSADRTAFEEEAILPSRSVPFRSDHPRSRSVTAPSPPRQEQSRGICPSSSSSGTVAPDRNPTPQGV